MAAFDNGWAWRFWYGMGSSGRMDGTGVMDGLHGWMGYMERCLVISIDYYEIE